MPELIDRLQTIQQIKNTFCSECDCEYGDASCKVCEYDFCIGILNEQPTIEAEPVRHGRWKCIDEYDEFGEEMADYLCVNCGYVISRLKNQKPDFCEGCGRDMRVTGTNGEKGGADNG
jgi:hypothetical protein